MKHISKKINKKVKIKIGIEVSIIHPYQEIAIFPGSFFNQIVKNPRMEVIKNIKKILNNYFPLYIIQFKIFSRDSLILLNFFTSLTHVFSFIEGLIFAEEIK